MLNTAFCFFFFLSQRDISCMDDLQCFTGLDTTSYTTRILKVAIVKYSWCLSGHHIPFLSRLLRKLGLILFIWYNECFWWIDLTLIVFWLKKPSATSTVILFISFCVCMHVCSSVPWRAHGGERAAYGVGSLHPLCGSSDWTQASVLEETLLPALLQDIFKLVFIHCSVWPTIIR